jgi:NTE family protein
MAVLGATSAFPPVLSPLTMEFRASAWAPASRLPSEDLHREPYLTDVVLTDGGVYDNLGLETAYKKYQTLLVSNGGGKMQPEPDPKGDWARHAIRINGVIDNQVRNLRVRQLIAAFEAKERAGIYWGIRTARHTRRRMRSPLLSLLRTRSAATGVAFSCRFRGESTP